MLALWDKEPETEFIIGAATVDEAENKRRNVTIINLFDILGEGEDQFMRDQIIIYHRVAGAQYAVTLDRD